MSKYDSDPTKIHSHLLPEEKAEASGTWLKWLGASGLWATAALTGWTIHEATQQDVPVAEVAALSSVDGVLGVASGLAFCIGRARETYYYEDDVQAQAAKLFPAYPHYPIDRSLPDPERFSID